MIRNNEKRGIMKITAEQFVESLARMSDEEAENCKSSGEQVVSLDKIFHWYGGCRNARPSYQ